MSEYNLLLELVKTNTEHVAKINDELGRVIERLAIVETKQNIVLALLVALVTKLVIGLVKNFRNNQKN